MLSAVTYHYVLPGYKVQWTFSTNTLTCLKDSALIISFFSLLTYIQRKQCRKKWTNIHERLNNLWRTSKDKGKQNSSTFGKKNHWIVFKRFEMITIFSSKIFNGSITKTFNNFLIIMVMKKYYWSLTWLFCLILSLKVVLSVLSFTQFMELTFIHILTHYHVKLN